MLISFFSKNRLSFWKNRFFFDYRIWASLNRYDTGYYVTCRLPCRPRAAVCGRPLVPVTTLSLISAGYCLVANLSASSWSLSGELPRVSKRPLPQADGRRLRGGTDGRGGGETTQEVVPQVAGVSGSAHDVSSVCLPSVNRSREQSIKDLKFFFSSMCTSIIKIKFNVNFIYILGLY